MSAAIAAAASSAVQNRNYVRTRRAVSSSSNNNSDSTVDHQIMFAKSAMYRYDDAKKQRDWNSFDQFRKTYYSSPISLARCSAEHVVQFLRHVDKLDNGNLDGMMNCLRVSFEENGGRREKNPFSSVAVKSYLRQINQQS